MSATKKDTKEAVEKTKREIEETVERVENTYDALVDRLKYERDRLERDLKHEYRTARRYVRSNPEQGVGVALLAGVVIGILIGRGSK